VVNVKNKIKRDLAEEVDLLDTMLTSLVELLEEKGLVTQEEWEKRIKENVTIEP
jgi:DNA-binding MarR family transcriptional regulator